MKKSSTTAMMVLLTALPVAASDARTGAERFDAAGLVETARQMKLGESRGSMDRNKLKLCSLPIRKILE